MHVGVGKRSCITPNTHTCLPNHLICHPAPPNPLSPPPQLHQLLTGRLPFWQNLSLPEVASLPPYAIIAAVRTHDVSYPRATWSKLSKEAQQLVAAMLERNPPDRISATGGAGGG